MKIRYFLTLPLFLFLLFFTSDKAQAVSDFDNLYQTVDSLSLESGADSSISVDVTYNYNAFFQVVDTWDGSGYSQEYPLTNNIGEINRVMVVNQSTYNKIQDWRNTKERWTITQYGQSEIAFCYTNDTSLSLVWYDGTGVAVNSANCFSVYYNTPSKEYVQIRDDMGSSFISAPDNGRKNFIAYLDYPNYPEGYEGELIREVAPSPGVSDIPNLYIQNILNYKVTFYDSSFFTFDNVPFTCDSGGVPVLYYELYKLDSLGEVLVLEGYNSASNLYEFDAGSSDIERNYRMKAWYYCGDDDLNFTEKASLEFTITAQGTQKYDIWENCLTDTFPYFNMDSCWSATMSVYELLFTGKILFPNWTFDATCHSMNSLDDWLGLQPGYVLCPQFPAYIRNTITPFIAFLLGIVTIGMIKRRSGS